MGKQILKKLLYSLALMLIFPISLHAMQQDDFLEPGSQEYWDNQLLQMIGSYPANVIKTLLEKGANPNYHDGKTTPFHKLVAMRTHTLGCKLLREYGANPLIRDSKGNTVLLKAASVKNLNLCKFIVDWIEKQHKQECITTLLLCLKRLCPQSVLYTQGELLLRPHLEAISYRPVEFLRMKNNVGKMAYDYLKQPFLNPTDQTPN